MKIVKERWYTAGGAQEYCNHVLQLRNSIVWAGHLGFIKTLVRIAKRFFCSAMSRNIARVVLTFSWLLIKPADLAMLLPFPAVDTPFEKISVNVVGPVAKSQKGNKFIFVIRNCATRYLKVYPLKQILAKQVLNAL